MRVVLWGPPGSGKTWLLHALVQQLNAFAGQDQANFAYGLKNPDNWKDIAGRVPDAYTPTLVMRDYNWLLSCEPHNNKQISSINKHQHYLHIIDDAGHATIQIRTEGHSKSTYDNFRRADVVFAMLDYTIVQQNPDTSSLYQDSPENYRQILANLFSVLTAKRPATDRCFVALCFTKADLLDVDEKYLPSIQLIKKYFGHEFANFIDGITEEYPQIVHDIFTMSAAGFQEVENIVPNYNSRGAIIDRSNWLPWRVHMPLLWALETEERRRIKRAGSWLARKIFAPQRQKLYQSKLLAYLYQENDE